MGEINGFYTMPHPPIVVHEVGRGEEKKVKKTSDACHEIGEEIGSIKPDTLIIVSPHGPVFSDAVALTAGGKIAGDFSKFRAPQVKLSLNVDKNLTQRIIEYAEKDSIPTAEITKASASQYGINYELDHGALVPLYFIYQHYQDFKIVHITYGMLSKMELYRFGMCIQKAVKDSHVKAVMIASGDLSHRLVEDGSYAYSPYGEKFDNEIVSLLTRGDVAGIFNMDPTMIEEAGECGLRSYYIMLGAMDGYAISGQLLAYEGVFGVGYAVMKFSLEKSKENMYARLIEENEKLFKAKLNTKNPYAKLARESLTHYLEHGKPMKIPSYVTDEMKSNKRGVFVTLKKEGQLRGCIGTVFPTTASIAEEIIRNAIQAGEHDPRFDPVSQEELPSIDFSVDVITNPEKASKDELDPKKYGVIVRSGLKSGLLLPDLEGVDTVERQLDIALQKGNISPYADYKIEKFEVIRHKEIDSE